MTARWVVGDSLDVKKFAAANAAALADDHDGALVFLARNAWHLQKAIDDFPSIQLSQVKS